MPRLSSHRWSRLRLPVLAGCLALLMAPPAVVGHRFSEFLIHPLPFEMPDRPERFGLAYTPLTLRSADGIRLDGWLLNPGQPRAVVFVHGWRSHKEHMLEPYLSWLASRYTVLALDLRNHGDSDGTQTTLGAEEVQDVLAATEWLKAHGYSRIGLMGVSMGASVALVAASREHALKAVVAEAAFATPPEITKGFFVRQNWRLKGLWATSTAVIGSLKTGTNWWNASAEQAVADLDGRPVLLIHGTKDHVILPENSTRLYRAAKPPKELWWVDGADHVSEPKTRPVAVQTEAYRSRVLRFFERAL